MKYNKGFGSIAVITIIVGVLVIIGGIYYFGKSSNEIEEEVTIDETSDWNKYTFTSTKYLPKSFSLKYPKEWKVEMGYYTEPASGKNVPISVILTSPNGIGQISYSAGSPEYKITCASLLSNTEVSGKLSCTEKEGIPYFVVYQEEETLKVYNKIMSTFEFLK